MRYVAAYMLGSLSGKTPTKDDIKKILGSVGIEYDQARAEQVVNQMAGKKLDDVIAAGLTKLSSMPSGGGAVAGAPAAAAADTSAAPAKEEKKKPEPESESDEDMGFGLFD